MANALPGRFTRDMRRSKLTAFLINPNIDYRSAGAGSAKLCFRGPLAEFVSFPFNYFSLVFGKIGLDVNGLGE